MLVRVPVVWIPRIPFMKGIVTLAYPIRIPNHGGPQTWSLRIGLELLFPSDLPTSSGHPGRLVLLHIAHGHEESI